MLQRSCASSFGVTRQVFELGRCQFSRDRLFSSFLLNKGCLWAHTLYFFHWGAPILFIRWNFCPFTVSFAFFEFPRFYKFVCVPDSRFQLVSIRGLNINALLPPSELSLRDPLLLEFLWLLRKKCGIVTFSWNLVSQRQKFRGPRYKVY